MKSMLTKPVGDICHSECHVACGPSATSANASSGSGGTRQSHANRSNIGTSRARRSNRLPIAKLTGEINSTAKAPTLKSKPTVPQIISRPIAATPMPVICSRVGISRNANAANATVNSAWLCTITLVRPTGHTVRNGPGLRQKLAEKQRAADRDQHRPGDIRPAHEQARHGRDRKAHRRHQRGREFVERQPARHEPETPDHRHQDGEADVGWLHRRR